MSTHYRNTTTLSQAMLDAEAENVVMRKGREYDRLLAAARDAVKTGNLIALERAIDSCEVSLARQAVEHARQLGLNR